MSLKWGSSMIKLNNIAEDLSKTTWPDTGLPMFNVTLFTERDTKMRSKISDTFHILEWNYNSNMLNSGKGLNVPLFIFHENRLMDDIFRGQNKEFVEMIKQNNFDGSMGL